MHNEVNPERIFVNDINLMEGKCLSGNTNGANDDPPDHEKVENQAFMRMNWRPRRTGSIP